LINGGEGIMADGSKVRALVARLRTLRRVVVRADIALSLAQAALCAVLIAISVVAASPARRRRARQGLAGPGDDKPAGFENPTTLDATGHDAHTAV
jgi:hypothetical protein